MAKETEL